MSDAFASSPATIGQLLSSLSRERIVIPTFQRGYMWKKKHVEAFWTDLERQREASKKLGSDQHFFGPIVTMAKPAERVIEILDGQQRLATATILFSVLRDVGRKIGKATGTNAGSDFAAHTQFQFIQKEEGFWALTLGATDELYFRETIQTDTPAPTRAKLFTHRNIKTARDVLMEKVEALTGGDPIQAVGILKELRQTIISDFVMARIPVTSQESAFKIFTTLNDRGLRLSPPDLLLSYLMEKASDGERLTIRSMWTEMIQRMGTHDMDRFMRHMWVSKYGDLKKVDLFTALSEHITKQQITSVEFARLCGDECDNYVQLLAVEKEHIPDKALPLVQAITRELNFQPAFPLLLSSYQLLQPDDFVKVAGCILVFVTRYAIIANQDSGGMEDLLYRLARDVRNKVTDENDKVGSEQACKHVRESLAANTPDDETVKKKTVENSNLDAADAKYVMTRLARYIQDPENQTTLGEANLEHIYPQSPDPAQWGGADNQAKLEPLTWNLGNLTIYGKRANRKVGNSEFQDKRPKYAASKIKMTSDLAAKYDHWDDQTIKQRAEEVAKLVVQIWKFDNTSRV